MQKTSLELAAAQNNLADVLNDFASVQEDMDSMQQQGANQETGRHICSREITVIDEEIVDMGERKEHLEKILDMLDS